MTPPRFMNPKEVRQTDRYIQFAMAAANQAVAESGLEVTDDNRNDVATIIGSGYGGIGTVQNAVETLATRGPGRVSPFLMPMMVTEMGAAKVSIAHRRARPRLLRHVVLLLRLRLHRRGGGPHPTWRRNHRPRRWRGGHDHLHRIRRFQPGGRAIHKAQ